MIFKFQLESKLNQKESTKLMTMAVRQLSIEIISFKVGVMSQPLLNSSWKTQSWYWWHLVWQQKEWLSLALVHSCLKSSKTSLVRLPVGQLCLQVRINGLSVRITADFGVVVAADIICIYIYIYIYINIYIYISFTDGQKKLAILCFPFTPHGGTKNRKM